MRLSSVGWVVALVGWMSAVAAPEVQCDELDVLLQDYREYELPLPPQDAQLATQEPDGPRVVYGVHQRSCTVLLIRPSDGSSRPVYLGGLQQVEARPDEEIRVVPPQLESLKGTKPFASDWWRRRFPEFPDLALAVQCKSLGWDEVARELLVRSHKRRGGYYRSNRRPRDHRDALAKMAWNYNCTQFASAAAAERRAILARMKHLLATRRIVNTKPNRTLIVDIEATLAATQSAPDSLEAAIDGLLELDVIPQNRQAKLKVSRFIESNPHAQRLQRAGWTAVPVLMEHLDDFRVTRLTPTTKYGQYDWHARIADVVAELLDGLASEPFAYDFLQAEGRGRQLDRAHVAHWWKQTWPVGELADLLDNAVARNSKGEVVANENVLRVLGAKYPEEVVKLFEKYRSEPWKSPTLFEALGDSKAPSEVKASLFLDVADGDDDWKQLNALRQLLSMKHGKAVPVLIDILERIPPSADEDAWRAGASHFAKLVAQTDDDEAWKVLLKTAKRVDVPQRRDILEGISNARQNQARVIEFLTKFLGDDQVRAKPEKKPATDDNPFGDLFGESSFDFLDVTVGDFAAMRLAVVLELGIEPDPRWQPADWGKLHRRVRQSLRRRAQQEGRPGER